MAQTRRQKISECLLVAGESGMTVDEIAEAVGITENSCYVMLSSMKNDQLVRRERVDDKSTRARWYRKAIKKSEVAALVDEMTRILAVGRLPREDRWPTIYERYSVE